MPPIGDEAKALVKKLYVEDVLEKKDAGDNQARLDSKAKNGAD